MVPPTFKENLPTLINVIYIILCRHLHRLVPMVILDAVKLTVIDCYNFKSSENQAMRAGAV